ncbi:MAG: hypothetical protein K0Q68_196 [Moraxellaceae bacterium]|jgi:hypothetical protein|nr:hypothetical protein [Moraxellaceae bacterium]
MYEEYKTEIGVFLDELMRAFAERDFYGDSMTTRKFGDFLNENEVKFRFEGFLVSKKVQDLLEVSKRVDCSLENLKMLSPGAFCYVLPWVIKYSFDLDGLVDDDWIYSIQSNLLALLAPPIEEELLAKIINKFDGLILDKLLIRAESMEYFSSGSFFYERIAPLSEVERGAIRDFLNCIKRYSPPLYELNVLAEISLLYEW